MSLTPQQLHRRMMEFRVGTLIKPRREVKLCELVIQKDGRAWLDWDDVHIITEYENKQHHWIIVDTHLTPGFGPNGYDKHYYVKIVDPISGRMGWTEALALFDPLIQK